MAKKRDPIFILPPFRVQRVMLAASQQIPWSMAGIPPLWAHTRGEGVRGAVLDTGCSLVHPDLVDAIEDAQDFTGSRSGPSDVNGHGTWCCGAIFAKDDSGGVVGPLNKGKALIGRVLGDSGSGTSEQVATGIRWAVKKGVDFISMSLGSQYEAKVITRACEEAREAGIPIIAAAGNEGPGPNTTGFPGSLPWVISVGAYGRDGKIAPFSSRGKVDICGPGVDVLGCWPPRSVAELSGTSMATPFVAAVVGLMIAKHKKHGESGNDPIDTPEQVLQRLKETAIDAGPSGFDPAYGWGLIDPAKLLAGAPPAPVGGSVQLVAGDLTESGKAKLRAAGMTHFSVQV